MMRTKTILDYGARADDDTNDTTPAVRTALAELQGTTGGRILFPKGRYHFWPERATERYLFISNNDESLKRIAFPLFGLHNIEVDGGGSEFVFHGSIIPFAVWDSHEVRLQNFTVDWERTFHSEVDVVEVRAEAEESHASVDLRIPVAYPYVVQNERLLFLGEDGETCALQNALEFDPVRRETAFRVHDSYSLRNTHQARELAPNLVRLTGRFGTIPTPGNLLAIVHTGRICPGIAIGDSSDIEICDVTLHHAGAMGVIAQRTRNLRLTRVQVTPAAHKGRLISTTADATHFVNCSGQIELTDCLFEGQMDDATNVHGVYARISRVVGRQQIEVELVHGQQVGIDITQPGDAVEFVNRHDLLTYHQADVTSVERLNRKYSLLTFSGNLPDSVVPGDAVASTGWTADVTIRGCTSRRNRARGFLLSTPGRVLIEDNYFHSPGAAILIAGDANYWFESGAVRDVTIRGNHFDNCNFGVWGRATIDVLPEIERDRRGSAMYHRGITLDANTFTAFDMRLLKAHCVDGLTITNNRIRASDQYPKGAEVLEPFEATDCRNVTIADNTISSEPAFVTNTEVVAAR
ncbi:MAG: right-handed parallel beta-helix repeat-containing protein [Cytophagales bacterium]|nr:right-handed parallel beta-helix repeat-containing protein [Armatimonadota bacterium]